MMAPCGSTMVRMGGDTAPQFHKVSQKERPVPLSGNVNYGGVSDAPEEDGLGGMINNINDESGIKLSVGDTVVFPNPTPGQNGLPNTPSLVGVIIAFGGTLFTANVPSTTTQNVAVSVYNLPCSKARQIYSAVPANMENGPVQGS